jgi:hypothetical protein
LDFDKNIVIEIFESTEKEVSVNILAPPREISRVKALMVQRSPTLSGFANSMMTLFSSSIRLSFRRSIIFETSVKGFRFMAHDDDKESGRLRKCPLPVIPGGDFFGSGSPL